MSKWYKIVNKKTHTDVHIYEEIGGWGVRARSFVKDLKEIKGDIVLHLNSPGGQVFDGLAIYNTLNSRDDKVTVKIEGLAASIASIIALAGDEIEMAENSMLMIHNPLISISGDSEEMRKAAETLDKIKESIVGIYVSHSNMTADEVSLMMDNETWLTAHEAISKGLCTKITAVVEVSNVFDSEEYSDNEGFNTYKQLQKDGGKMEEILEKLGVKDKTEALLKIESMEKDNDVLQTKITALEESQKVVETLRKETAVTLAIAENKLTPAQKDFAMKLITQDEDLFKEFVAESQNQAGVFTPVDVENNNSSGDSTLTWGALIEDPEKAETLLKTDPKTYHKLLDEFMEKCK